jgi:Cys-rich repeat protein
MCEINCIDCGTDLCLDHGTWTECVQCIVDGDCGAGEYCETDNTCQLQDPCPVLCISASLCGIMSGVEQPGYYCEDSGDICCHACGDGYCWGSESVATCPGDCTGDTCADGITITSTGTYNGDTTGLVNDYSPTLSTCTGFSQALGADQVWEVHLDPGERIIASMDTEPYFDAALYLVTDCADIDGTCVAGSDSGDPEVISYTSAAGGVYYLIADGWSTGEGPYILDVNIEIPPPPGPGEDCTDPLTISGSGIYGGDTTGMANDYAPILSTCTGGLAAAGADEVWEVTLAEGQILTVSMDAPLFDAVLYLVTDCSDIDGSCVAGSDTGNPETINYTATADGTYYLIADGYLSTSEGPYTLDVDIETPATGETCADPLPITCNGTYNGDTTGMADDYAPTTTACTGTAAAAGADQVWEVTLGAGEQITASMDAAFNAVLYLVSDCGDIDGTCLDGSDSGNPETISYASPGGGTYYLIADGRFSTSEGPYTLDVAIGNSSGCDLPYITTWDVDEECWVEDPVDSNWILYEGFPWALDQHFQFYWSPTVTFYTHSITSVPFNLSTCGSATLSFDIYFLDWTLSDTNNSLTAECYDGSSWQPLWYWDELLGDEYGPLTEVIGMDACLGATDARVRFVAEGDDSYDINYWHVDDVQVL